MCGASLAFSFAVITVVIIIIIISSIGVVVVVVIIVVSCLRFPLAAEAPPFQDRS